MRQRLPGFCILLISLLLLPGAFASEFKEDSKGIISVIPSVLVGSGYVHFNLTSKAYSGPLSLIAGFDVTHTQPKTFEYYNPWDETVQKSYTCLFDFDYTLDPKYFWCRQNGTVIFEHSFLSGDIETATAYWDEIKTHEWRTVPGDLTVFNRDFDNKNRWYLMENMPVTAGTEYQARIWINTPYLEQGESPEGWDSKYDIGFFPSSYGTNILNAISDNKFFYIDPYTQPGGVDVDKFMIIYDFENSSNICEDSMFYSDCAPTLITRNFTAGNFKTGSQAAAFGENAVGGEADNRLLIDLLGDGMEALSFWMKSTDSSTAQYLLSDADNPQPIANKGAIGVGRWQVSLNFGTGELGYYSVDPGNCTYSDDVFEHWVFRAIGTETAIYKNSVLCGISSDGGGTALFDATFFFGDHPNTAAQYTVDAFIDQVIVFNDTLTQADIDWLYNGGAGQYPVVAAALPASIVLNVTSITPLNSSSEAVANFSTEFLIPIEYAEINISVELDADYSSSYFNFTANGSNACALGNKQFATCYSIDAGNWIQYVNGTETSTFKDEGAQGDRIIMTQDSNLTDFTVSFNLDEIYNPNVYKHYPFNFSSTKWQAGVAQRIYAGNLIKIQVSPDNIPLDADQYKLDFRADYSALTPNRALEAYACNSTYSTGSPEGANCVFIGSLMPDDFQDDGTKYRLIFTKELIDGLGNLKYIILESHGPANKYYYIKTYGITDGHLQNWTYSSDDGASWVNSRDGYESELNINWFYNTNATQFNFAYYVQTVTGSNDTVSGSFTWTIDASQNYAPSVSISSPSAGDVEAPFNVSYASIDPNNDNLTGNVTLYYVNGSVYAVYANITDTDTVTLISENATIGTYNLTVELCENETADLFCASDTVEITFPTPGTEFSGLSCYYGSEPYYFFDGFNVFCSSTVQAYSCIGMLRFNDDVIQTVPKKKVFEDGTAYDAFTTEDYNIIIQFDTWNLRTGEEINVSIRCGNGSDTMTGRFAVTPSRTEPFYAEDVAPYTVTNMLLLLLAFFGFLIIIVLGVWIWKNW